MAPGAPGGMIGEPGVREAKEFVAKKREQDMNVFELLGGEQLVKEAIQKAPHVFRGRQFPSLAKPSLTVQAWALSQKYRSPKAIESALQKRIQEIAARHVAVERVQSWWRGTLVRRARRRARTEERATLQLQAWCRGVGARREVAAVHVKAKRRKKKKREARRRVRQRLAVLKAVLKASWSRNTFGIPVGAETL